MGSPPAPQDVETPSLYHLWNWPNKQADLTLRLGTAAKAPDTHYWCIWPLQTSSLSREDVVCTVRERAAGLGFGLRSLHQTPCVVSTPWLSHAACQWVTSGKYHFPLVQGHRHDVSPEVGSFRTSCVNHRSPLSKPQRVAYLLHVCGVLATLYLTHHARAINVVVPSSFTHSTIYWTPIMLQALFWVLGNMLVDKSERTPCYKGSEHLRQAQEEINP